MRTVLPKDDAKRSLELLGVPHLFVNNEYVVVEEDHAEALLTTLNIHDILVKEDVEGILKSIAEFLTLNQTISAVL